MSYTCGNCGNATHNPDDVAHRFCPHCRAMHDPRWPAFYVYRYHEDIPFTETQAAAVAALLDEIRARMARNRQKVKS